MAGTENNGSERELAGVNGFLLVSEASTSATGSAGDVVTEGEKDSLSFANILRSRNKFVDALALYERVLENDSGNVEALIGKGICLQMQNMGKLAFDSFSEAIRLNPQNACALTHCGILFKEEGRLLEAAESYQKALQADPSYKAAAECLAIVLTDIGTNIKLAGNTQEGIQKYFEALKIDPHYAPAYYNLGVVYSEMMQYDMALTFYEKAATERPMYAEAYCNMGVIFKNRGDLGAAITCYERCLAVSPNFEIAKNNMAIALTDLGTKVKLEGEINQGVAFYKKALYYNWRYADAMYNLGVAYGEMLKFDMAIVFYELAFHFNPRCAEACNNLGVIYKDRDNLDKAVECYQLALSIKPNFSQSLNNLGVVYTVQGKMDAAASMIEKAIIANPTYAEAYNNLGVLYRDAGEITQAINAYEQCLKIDPDSRNAGQNRLLAMNYIDEGNEDKLFEAHRDWGSRFMRLYSQYTSWDNTKDPERPLVIGYVSPDYFTHSVSYFIEAPLVCHDYTKYKVIVYSAVVKADAKTIRFREKVVSRGGIWRDIYGTDEKKVADMVREDQIDILVELTGHTANNKLGMMACRPAPVQVTWIGYPNTTGLPAIDYRITDSLADSPKTKQKHVEELVRLPECFLCYTPSPEAGPVCPTPALSNGFITFGSFNNLAKITPKVLQVWARILCAVPNSRLVVKCKPFCCDSVKQRFLSTLEQLGLKPLRVDLLPLILLNHDHMQAYSLMDISGLNLFRRFCGIQNSNQVSPFSSEKIGISNVLEADAHHIAAMARETFHKDGPLLVVASGRDTISVATSIKRLAPENVFLVQIQHPRFRLNRFDLVITPQHDYYPLTPHAQQQIPWFLRKWVTPWEPPGRNVVLTVGALHQSDSTALRVAASTWHDELATLPKPLLVVNVGGPTGNCPYGVDLAKQLVVMLQNVLWSCGTIRISFSRRTPEKISRTLVKEFATNPKVQIWDGKGPNPHMGHLAWADAFVITADSVSMLSEACSTGKPVYVTGAERCTWKFADFQNTLQKQGVARPFTGKENMTESWSYPPLNDTAEAASQVIAALAQRGWTICA